MCVRGVTRRCWHRKWLFWHRKWLFAFVIAFVVLAQVFPVLWRPLGHVVELWMGDRRLAAGVSDSLFTAKVVHQSPGRQRRRQPTVYSVSPSLLSRPSPVHLTPPGEHVSQLRRGERKRPFEGNIHATLRPTDRDRTMASHKWNPVSPSSGYTSNCSTLGPLHRRVHCLQNDTTIYFHKTYNWKCFIEGTANVTSSDGCLCRKGWFGSMCSVPTSVHVSNYPDEYGLGAMTVPRRIIYAFPFANEFDLLEARLRELAAAVDVYVILESNYTASGRAKELKLLRRMRNGYLQTFHSKIVYVLLDYFPEEGYADGWAADALLRNYIGYDGFSRIRGIRDDDLIVSTDADEVPKRASLVFLKVHYGYPEPIGFNLRHSVFGFFYRYPDDGNSHVFGACSVAMMKQVFDGYLYRLRRATKHMTDNSALVNRYKYKGGGRIHAWSFGSPELSSGWHCSWCFTAEGIRFKLLAAHLSDMPRWGAFPSKLRLSYIRNIVERGLWFDDETKLVETNQSDIEMYAPAYFRNNADTFKHILKVPYRKGKSRHMM